HNSLAEPPEHRAARAAVDGDSLCVPPGKRNADELANVLPRRGFHASRDEERGAHGTAVRFDVDCQFGGLLRHSRDDSDQQSLCTGDETAEDLAILCILEYCAGDQYRAADEYVPGIAGMAEGCTLLPGDVCADLFRGHHLQCVVQAKLRAECGFRIEY